MVGIYWGINIALALLQALIGLGLAFMYLRSTKAVGSRVSKLLLGLALLVAFQGVAASVSYYLLAGATGPEVAIPLIPISLLGTVVAGTLFYIASR